MTKKQTTTSTSTTTTPETLETLEILLEWEWFEICPSCREGGGFEVVEEPTPDITYKCWGCGYTE